MKKLLLFAIVILGFSAVSFGQATTANINNAKASATVLAPLTINKGATELNFGVLSSDGIGTVSIGIEDDVTVGGGAKTYSGFGAQPKSAIFNIGGTRNNQFNITLPQGVTTLYGKNGADGSSMTIAASTWVTNITNVATLYTENRVGSLNDAGIFVLKVGATLSVGAGQTSGNYEGEYEITIAYQ